MTSRRGFLLGLGAALAAPAIVKAESIMRVAVLRDSVHTLTLDQLPSHTHIPGWIPADGRWLSQRTYPALYAAIGEAFTQQPIPKTMFALPDMRANSPVAVPAGSLLREMMIATGAEDNALVPAGYLVETWKHPGPPEFDWGNPLGWEEP